MPKETVTAKEQLRELEKLVKKIVKGSLKDNTLDYTVQISISNLEKNQVKYAAQISSPAKGVQPITFSFNTFNELKTALEESVNTIDKDSVEIAFHENMVLSLEKRLKAHKERIEQIKSGETVEMEEV